MKAKLFFLVTLVAFLSLVPATVLAETDPVSMWVSRVRLAYTGRSSTGTDTIVGLVHVRDANKRTVVGATVTASWTLPTGEVIEEKAVTSFQGIAQFSRWDGRGTYALAVSDVTKDGWIYVPTQSYAVTASIIAR